MKTTNGRVLTAYSALVSIRNKVKGKDALAMFYLKRKLQENVDFVAEEEQKLVTEHGGAVAPNGTIAIPEKEKWEAFLRERKELMDMEIEIDFPATIISLDQNPEITMESIEQLDGFVKFI